MSGSPVFPTLLHFASSSPVGVALMPLSCIHTPTPSSYFTRRPTTLFVSHFTPLSQFPLWSPSRFNYCSHPLAPFHPRAPRRLRISPSCRLFAFPKLSPSSSPLLSGPLRDPRVIKLLRVAAMVGATTASIITAVIVVFWIIQDSLVYKPVRLWRGTPGGLGMNQWDDVRYCTMDGVEISGWFIHGKKGISRRTMIYFHGTDKNASFRLKKVIGFWEKCSVNVLLLSYRGYGTSTGHPNEKGMCIDAESAMDYLRARGDVSLDPQDNASLFVFGESLGGAVALHFTKRFEQQVTALILENTFTSLLDMIKLEFPILGIFRYLSRNKWRSDKRIRSLTLPILFLSGLRDSYIPPKMMKTLHQAASKSQFTRFVEFDNGTHNRTWTSDGFYEAVASFMNEVENFDILDESGNLPISRVDSMESSMSQLSSDEGGYATAPA